MSLSEEFCSTVCELGKVIHARKKFEGFFSMWSELMRHNDASLDPAYYMLVPEFFKDQRL